MPDIDFGEIIGKLREADVFSDDQMVLLEAAGDELLTWSPDDFVQTAGLTRLESMSAQRLVREAFGMLGVTEDRRYEIPERPPYLVDPGHPATYGKQKADGSRPVQKAGSTGDYDPKNPMQFMQIGDQYFRWDGKRSERHPYGQPHEITFVDHRIIDRVPVPDPKQAAAALAAGLEWWHKGYECWIRWNGKRSVEVSREMLTAVRNVTGPRARATA